MTNDSTTSLGFYICSKKPGSRTGKCFRIESRRCHCEPQRRSSLYQAFQEAASVVLFGERAVKMGLDVPMENKIAESSRLFDKLKSLLGKGDYDQAEAVLLQLKVNLTEFLALPPLFQLTPTTAQELILARDIFEHAVLLSVRTEDQESFERHFLQLKSFYTDTRDVISRSPQEYPMLGLNLLRLLVQNRIGEFHTELELLAPEAHNNPCIRHAVELEQSFMEGAYSRVLNARRTVPNETYVYFMDLLAKTVRDEIAGCSEKTYDFLTVQDAKKLLMFSTDNELLDYVREEHPNWELRNGSVYFQKIKETAPYKEIPSLQLISQTLGYARELERIV